MATNFVAESWTYLAIDLVIISTRIGWRIRTAGLRKLAPDDYLMVVAGLLYTAETATAYYVGAYWFGLANNSMTPEERAALNPLSLEYHLRVKGSQTQLFGWLDYTVLLWTLKLCWLFFYSRLGEGVNNMRLKVTIGFIIVPITFFATFFTIIFGCWPVSKHWQINPDPGNFCQPAISKLQVYTLISTNLSTDFYIMSIPFPMIWATRLSVKKKLGIGMMFCGGILTTVAGLLRCILILTSGAEGPQQAGEWSCRESFLAVFVSNIPVLFPLIHRTFNRITNQVSTRDESSRTRSYGLRTFGSSKKMKKFKHPLSIPDETVMNDTIYERYDSNENIVLQGTKLGPIHEHSSHNSDGAQSAKGDEIRVTMEWDVESNKDTNNRRGNFEKDRHNRMFGNK